MQKCRRVRERKRQKERDTHTDRERDREREGEREEHNLRNTCTADMIPLSSWMRQIMCVQGGDIATTSRFRQDLTRARTLFSLFVRAERAREWEKCAGETDTSTRS